MRHRSRILRPHANSRTSISYRREETLTNVYVMRYASLMDITTTSQPRAALATSSATACCDGVAASITLDSARATTLASRLKALADPTRLRMLDLLAAQPQQLCVCDITSQFRLRQPTISHHLRILRQAGLISGEKRGVWSYYWATDEGKRDLALLKTFT
jgi:ArsR family transcriptional regulator, arsenate/arsenite/antimonite-responsive transcriptional repressor